MFITGRRELGLVVKMEKGNTASINGTRGGVVHAEVTSKHTSGKYHEEKQVNRELKQSNSHWNQTSYILISIFTKKVTYYLLSVCSINIEYTCNFPLPSVLVSERFFFSQSTYCMNKVFVCMIHVWHFLILDFSLSKNDFVDRCFFFVKIKNMVYKHFD